MIGVLEYVSKEIKKQGDQELPPQIVSTNENVEDQPNEEEKRSLSIVLQDVEVHSDSTLELDWKIIVPFPINPKLDFKG